MAVTVIHQLAHGYRRGHQLLAGSTEIDKRSAELILRLSDLSGPSSSETSITPYLTAYPLPFGGLYAVAKTWPDEQASRSGCVLTHTLLIQSEYWAGLSEPVKIEQLFSRPENADDTDAYRMAIEFDDSRGFAKTLEPPRQETAIEFVAKYFGEGLRPLVWLGEERPEDVFWYLTRALWSRLRAEFACCTFSLQPRALEDREFDLLLAPLSVQSRFLRLPRENILSAAPRKDPIGHVRNLDETWHYTLSDTIFGGHIESQFPKRNDAQLRSLLTKDPTAIRNLFLIEKLRNRINETPTAPVGLMDAVAAFAPNDTQIINFKDNLVATAMEAAANVPDSGEALKCFFLIGERLGRLPFKRTNPKFHSQLSEAVAQRTVEDTAAALEIGERFLHPNAISQDSPYANGVIRGLMNVAEGNPSQLSVLHRFPVAAATVIEKEPAIAQGFLRGMKERSHSKVAQTDLVGWLAASAHPTLYRRLQETLLPQIEGDDEAVLATELLAHVDKTSVKTILNTLCQSTNNFKSKRLRQIIGELISEVFPEEVREWGRSTKRWSGGVANIVAAAYPVSAKGFTELLAGSWGSDERKAEIIGVFLDAASARGLPLWLKDQIRDDASFLVPVLTLGINSQPNLCSLVGKILEEVSDVSIAISSGVIEKITSVQHQPVAEVLVDRGIRGTIIGFIKGKVDRDSLEAWYLPDWSVNWFEKVDSWDLESLVVGRAYESHESWKRAWTWTAEAPEVLYFRTPPIIPILTEKLVRARRDNWKWSSVLTETWIRILRRTSNANQTVAFLQLSSHALDFAFSHKEYPLGGLAAESFPSVYNTIIRSPTVSPMTSIILGIISLIDSDWDKGKDLRQKLVNAFMESNWAPGDLAIAAHDTELLRKLFKRVMRRRDGKHYIAAMLKDLKGRKELPAGLLTSLNKLIEDPNFTESWE